MSRAPEESLENGKLEENYIPLEQLNFFREVSMAPRSAAWKTESGSMNRRQLSTRTVAKLTAALVISAAAGYGASALSSSGAAPIVLRYPTELAVSPKGNLYIGDTGLDQILERLASGSFRSSLETGAEASPGTEGLLRTPN